MSKQSTNQKYGRQWDGRFSSDPSLHDDYSDNSNANSVSRDSDAARQFAFTTASSFHLRSRPRTYKDAAANEWLSIYLFSYDYRQLDAAVTKLVKAIEDSNSEVHGPIPLPTELKDGLKVYKRLVAINPSGKQLERLAKFDLPLGVEVYMEQDIQNIHKKISRS